jgi:hypothetical protein
MEIEQIAKRLMQSGENPVSMPSEEQLKVITKWVGMFMELNHQEVSELGMAAYIEGLKDLTVGEIERGCMRALKEVDRMPNVAHIRARVNAYEEPKTAGEDRGCEKCRFTGWRTVDRPDGLGKMAIVCECRKTK